MRPTCYKIDPLQTGLKKVVQNAQYDMLDFFTDLFQSIYGCPAGTCVCVRWHIEEK